MKVTTQLSTPIEALLAPRTGAREENGASFPDTLRRAQGNESDDRARSTARDEETAPAAERAREDDRRVDAETTNEDRVQSSDDDTTDTVDASGAEGETQGDATDATPSPTGATAGAALVDPLLTAAGTSTSAAETTVATATVSATTTPLAGPTATAPTDGPSVATTATVAGTDTTAHAASKGTANPQGGEAAHATPLETKTQTTTSVSPSGTSTAEGETAVPVSRGEAQVAETRTVPLATRESLAANPTGEGNGGGWFEGEGETSARDRSAFHLLDGETAPADRAEKGVDPVAVPARPAPPVAETPSTITAREAGPVDPTNAPTSSAPGLARAEQIANDASAIAREVIVADPARPTALARKIFRQVGRSLARGENELKIRLDPPRLGRVDVDLRVDSEKLTVRFVVETEEVRDVLRTHIDDLHRSLDGHGWRAESVEIDLREGGERHGFDGGRRDSRARDDAPGELPLEAEVADRELRLWHLGKTVVTQRATARRCCCYVTGDL